MTEVAGKGLLDGSYRSIIVQGDTAVMKDHNGASHTLSCKLGQFGEADPKIIKITGQNIYNVELSFQYKADITELGIISANGLKVTIKGTAGITVLHISLLNKVFF